MRSFRIFVIVPGAGLSRRMGKPKLLLPLGSKTVIEHTLDSFRGAGVAASVVVLRPNDVQLAAAISRTDSRMVFADPPPPDMRASVELGLYYLDETFGPDDSDVWVLCPGDCVGVSTELVTELLDRWAKDDADVLVPVYRERRGHPALFRWTLAKRLGNLPEGKGVNSLRTLPGVRLVQHPVDCDSVLADMDTPDDYNATRDRWRDKENTS